MKIKQMQAICDHLNIDLRVGDYDYAACYTKTCWENGDWSGYWFAHECELAIIYVPISYSVQYRAYGFFHELGHILDYIHGVEFETTWDEEVSAWEWSWILCRLNGWNDIIDFKADVIHCLGTYNKSGEHDMNAALKVIGVRP